MIIARMSATLALAALLFVFCAGSASAVEPAPGWTIDSFATPTNFSTKEGGEYTITARNAGDVSTDGSGITLTDKLPRGLTVQGVSLFVSSFGGGQSDLGSLLCSATPVKCEYPGAYGGVLPVLEPDATLDMIVHVTIEPNTPQVLVNEASVSGGGAPEASIEKQNLVSLVSASFGASNFNFYIDGLDGKPDTQAGDHPYELTTTIGLDNGFRINGPQGVPGDTSVQDVKDIVADLPLGFVGSTLAAPECPLASLSGKICPANTIVGHIETEPLGATGIDSPIYNLVPERGVPAEFGYSDALHGSHVFYVRVVPTPAGYVLQTTNADIPAVNLSHIVVTFYGDPTARDASRVCGSGSEPKEATCREALDNAQVPFFTNPTDCSGSPMVATLYMDSWQNPGSYDADGSPNFNDSKWVSATSESPPLTGCNALQFPAEVAAQPTTHESDKPSGLNFQIKLPQSETVGVPATPTLKKIVTTLPEGFTVDPSAGDGLAACSEAQIGWLGGTDLNFSAAAPECPEASKIGSLELESPLIPRKLEGVMYLAEQNENPFDTTLAAYVVVDDPITGVLIKIPGEFLPDPHTGRLTAVFDENPNLPFSDLQLHFFGGPRAELATPESCGTFTVGAELTPYSAPDSGPATDPFDDFLIDEACPSGFSPSFAASDTNVQAGAFSPFIASFSRSDTDQELAGLTVTLPPGLSADLTGVPLCSDAQAAAAVCPEGTQVGTVLASVGPGPNPLQVPGKAYFTGPYNGGPYGLAVVVPAVAGPFNFGTVVVRQSIRINPLTAQVTDVSDPFPKIVDGIPLRMRRIDLTLNRPDFTFNPTSCEKLGFAGSISGSPLGAPTTLNGTIGYATQPGATASFTTPFQVTNCAALAFKPRFSVSTTGKTSRADGAGLDVKLSYPAGSFGKDANVHSVKVDLPKQLPSRLTTLQKACTNATFEANPAACPAESRVGSAIAVTPILATPLAGPAYFVSHGGAKFPELVVVLSGGGIVVQLHGETFISKAGITSSTFKSIPDVPIGSFELVLPQGKYSALAANGNLCTSTLKMPTSFVAQNGAEIHQSTPISVSGCKAAIGVLRHGVKAATASIAVSVPSAGKLLASGKGLSGASKKVGKAGTATLTLSLTRAERQFLSHHPGRKLRIHVRLLFLPAHGAKLTSSVTLLMG
jgi:uncharacterized repeat protein (TIGR01451 family)